MNSLHLVDEHIESQNFNEVSGIITSEEIKLLGYNNIQEFLVIIQKLNQLQLHIWSKLDVVDIDDTLWSRYNTLQYKDLSDKRWDLWNKDIVENQGWYLEFAKNNYNWSSSVKEMVDIIVAGNENNKSIVLTAWVKEFQEAKLSNMWLGKVNKWMLVVDKSSEKPKKLFEYIINDLGYIPNYVNIFDDRVTYFNILWPIISKILWSKLIVNEVMLSTSDTTKIQSVNQSVYEKEAA